MSRFVYWKVSAVYLFITVASNLDTIVRFGLTCNGDGGHCGG
jgi:hypothetical protein